MVSIDLELIKMLLKNTFRLLLNDFEVVQLSFVISLMLTFLYRSLN